MNLFRPGLAKFFAVLTVTMMVVVLVFRFAVYRHLYIAPGDPYGISDVIEWLLWVGLLVVLGCSVFVGLLLAIIGPCANRIAAAWLIGVCVVVAVLVMPLHTLAARWAL